MPTRKGLLAPQNTFLDTIATRFDGTRKLPLQWGKVVSQLVCNGSFFECKKMRQNWVYEWRTQQGFQTDVDFGLPYTFSQYAQPKLFHLPLKVTPRKLECRCQKLLGGILESDKKGKHNFRNYGLQSKVPDSNESNGNFIKGVAVTLIK